MSRRSPYILLSFANPQLVPAEYLASLNQEQAKVTDYLQPLDFQNICDVTVLSSATLKQVLKTIQTGEKHADLMLFHYGGHANGGGLLLNTDSGDTEQAQAIGLARALGRIPSLKLVFLNGCSTKGQVELLFEHGVKAVIATSQPIHDQMAVDLADWFYSNLVQGDTIRSAFEKAKDLLLGKSEYQNQAVLSPDETRSLELDDTEDSSENSDALPWGLYVKPGQEEVLSWSLPQDSPPPPSRLGEYDRYTCDRAEQNTVFRTQWANHRGEQRVQHFFIHGEEEQSPRGLFNRFVFKEIKEGYERIFHKEVVMEEPFDLESAKLNLGTALFKAVELSPNRFKPKDLTLINAARSPALNDVQCVAIKFKVYSSTWKDFTDEFLDWFLERTTKDAQQVSTDIEWLFFFGVVYDESAQQGGGFFKKLFSKNPKDKILASVQKRSPHITVLKELPPVVKPDIEKWLDRVTDDYGEKQQYLNNHFSGPKDWKMVEVESKLQRIIEAYNEEALNI